MSAHNFNTTIKLPFDLESALHGESVCFDNNRPVIQLLYADKADTPVIAVNVTGQISLHPLKTKLLFMPRIALPCVIDDLDVCDIAAGARVCTIADLRSYTVFGGYPEITSDKIDYMKKIGMWRTPHLIYPSEIDICIENRGLIWIDTVKKWAYLTDQTRYEEDFRLINYGEK